MFRSSHEVTAFGCLFLLFTGCGGLMSGGDDDDDCAAADCSGASGGATGGAGAGTGAGRSGGAGTDAGRGGTGNETGGTGGSGSPANRCAAPSDCTLVAVDCCGSCQPTASDFVALNVDAVNDYLASRPCTDRICPECEPTGVEWLTAICVTGVCDVLDARESELSACDVSDDCALRKSLECCECGASGGWVSLNVSSSATLTGLVCDAEQACDTCVPSPPPTLTPACVAGRCQTMLPTR